MHTYKCLAFLCGFWQLSAGLHASRASISLTELAYQPWGTFLFFVFLLFLESGFLCVTALADLKLALWTMLSLNSQRSTCLLSSSEAGIKVCTTMLGKCGFCSETAVSPQG